MTMTCDTAFAAYTRTTVADLSPDTVQRFSQGEKSGLIHQTASNDRLDGRTVTLRGRDMVNFGSCGYTGLETHPALVQAVVDAVSRYGTQFSSSRVFLSSPDYPAAEEALKRMFGRPVVIATSTSMANMAALTTQIASDDVVFVDIQAHRSLRVPMTILRSQGTRVQFLGHNAIKALRRKIRTLGKAYRRIWYVGDGLYSMFGDFAPVAELDELARENPDLWLYLDDAHSISWTGQHGRGHVLEKLSPQVRERTIVTASLNKSFAAAGGVITCPDAETAHMIFSHAWPMVFSGPIQPPMLGAVLASARLHLSDEILPRQGQLLQSIRAFNSRANQLGIPVISRSDTPIRYIAVGDTDAAAGLAHLLQAEGLLVNCVSYPAVPHRRSGLRVALNLHQTREDIEHLLTVVADHLPRIFATMQRSPASLVDNFQRHSDEEFARGHAAAC